MCLQFRTYAMVFAIIIFYFCNSKQSKAIIDNKYTTQIAIHTIQERNHSLKNFAGLKIFHLGNLYLSHFYT